MISRRPTEICCAALLAAFLLCAASGCHFGRWQLRPHASNSAGLANCLPEIAREKEKVILPEYRIEPPDVLQVNAVRLVPKAPYELRIGDELLIEVVGTLPDAPIRGTFPIGIGGVVDLRFSYGTVPVRGLTVEGAREVIEQHLEQFLREPQVTVTLGNIGTLQQITGPRPVQQDGRVNLGVYGQVNVAGLTIEEARKKMQEHLSEFLDNPEISVIVQNTNSKFYYLITQGAGVGDTIRRVPITGNETVIDALGNLGRIPQQNSTKMWIARPAPGRKGHEQILLVNWQAISQLGETDTNYQLLPGDRLYIAEKPFVRLDNDLRTLTRPFITASQFINLMLGTIRNLNAGVSGQAATAFQNIGGQGGLTGGNTNLPPIGVTPIGN